ncbi:MAG: hypothetical protein WCK73_08855, partial [Deltaproteobacteria bacterium]
SGCGKSQTAFSIMRLLAPNAFHTPDSKILFNGGDLLKRSEAEMEKIRGNKIAMIFQEPMTSLNPLYRIGNQLAEPLLQHRGMTPRQARAQALEAAKAAAEPLAPPPPLAPDESKLQAETERADKAEVKLAEARKKAAEMDRDLKAAKGRLETDKRVYMVQKGELDIAKDRYNELKRRHDALRKEHEELIDAVRQAAREERRAQAAAAAASPPSPGTPSGE